MYAGPLFPASPVWAANCVVRLMALQAPARPYYPGATYKSRPPRTHTRQGRLQPILLSSAPLSTGRQHRPEQAPIVERQPMLRVAGSYGRLPQTANTLSRSLISRSQQLVCSRSNTRSLLSLPKSKSQFRLSGSSITGGAESMLQARRSHSDLQARRSHSEPEGCPPPSLSLSRRAVPAVCATGRVGGAAAGG